MTDIGDVARNPSTRFEYPKRNHAARVGGQKSSATFKHQPAGGAEDASLLVYIVPILSSYLSLRRR